MRWILSCVLFAALAPAQDFSHFEAASVKLAEPFPALSGAPPGAVAAPIVTGGLGSKDPGQISYRGIWLPTLINAAYGVRSFQVTGPAWLGEQRYDIVAKIPAGATKDQFNLMLQNLLRERFNLTLHRDSKTFPVYALTVGKNGPKLKESPKEPEPPSSPASIGKADANGFPSVPPNFSGVVGLPSPGRIHLTGQRAEISKLTGWLEGRLDHPIVDQTGLTGQYDFKLELENGGRPGVSTDNATDPAPTVFQVVEKELGLKLELTKVPFDVLIIDRLDREPSAN